MESLRHQSWPVSRNWSSSVITGIFRYLAGQDPIGYRDKVNKKRILMCICAVWLMSAVLSFPAIYWWRSQNPELHDDPVIPSSYSNQLGLAKLRISERSNLHRVLIARIILHPSLSNSFLLWKSLFDSDTPFRRTEERSQESRSLCHNGTPYFSALD